MAQGITNRLRLALPITGDGTEARRSLMRWANGLPFAAVGFHFARTSDDSAIADTSSANITFNSVSDDKEGWWTPGASTQATFTVPPGLSGIFHLEGLIYVGASPAAWQISIRVNGNAVASSDFSHATDRRNASATVALQEGDSISLSLVNFSGGNITPTHTAADTNTPETPMFRGYRISLL